MLLENKKFKKIYNEKMLYGIVWNVSEGHYSRDLHGTSLVVQ